MSERRGARRERARIDLVAEVGEHGIAPRVVHDRVELRAVEPPDRVVPGLADDEGIGFRPLYPIAEGAPETMVDLVRDVEAPTIDIRIADPFLPDADEVFAQLGIRCV